MLSKQVTLVGHGWHLVPRIPFELGLFASGDAVIVHHGPPSMRKLRVAVLGGRVQVALDPGTASPEDVLLDFYDGEPLEGPGWSLRCDAGYLLPLPAGTRIWSTQDHVDWPVEIIPAEGAHRDEMVYVQGPFDRARAPVLASLVDAGMVLVNRAELAGVRGAIEVIEIGYTHEGAEWRQWRYLVSLGDDRVVLLTAQASVAGRQSMLDLGQAIATGLR